MRLIITRSGLESAQLAAEAIRTALVQKPDMTLGLATGSTPIPVYQALVDAYQQGRADFSRIHAVNLDEYVGLSPDHPQSYRRYMEENLFRPVGIRPEQVVIPRGDLEPEGELVRLNQFTAAHPIDLQLLSVGVNGHIGFNEPESVFYDKYHLVSLAQQTRISNARFFSSMEEVPTQAITMGVGDIMRAGKIVFLATGQEKLPAMQAILEPGPVTPACQGTVLKLHRDCDIYLDQELAGQITPAPEVEVIRVGAAKEVLL